MPIYAYKCEECSTKYEVFHKVKENLDDVICPSCESKKAKKLMSAPSVCCSSSSSSYSSGMPAMPPCAGGACGFN
jgi:putative FmdB family regulatory protein